MIMYEEREMDWKRIKEDYLHSARPNYAALARKYGVSRQAVSRRAKREGWNDSLQNSFQEEMEEVLRLMLKKLRQAVEEVEQTQLRTVVKTKEIEYRNDGRPDKPTGEILREEESFRTEKGLIDSGRLKQLTAILKELKELEMPKSELDLQEQMARIAKLQKECEAETENGELRVLLEGDAKIFAH